MKPSLLFLLALALTSCSNGSSRNDGPYCGDGIRNGSETCDGPDLGGATCRDFGYAGGRLGCLPDCTLDTRACSATCGNGALDPGEECEPASEHGPALGDLACEGWGALSCDEVCVIDRSGCAAELLAERQRISVRTPAFVAAGKRRSGGKETVELWVTQSEDHRVELYPYSAQTGFTDAQKRVLSLDLDRLALQPAVGDFNRDGSTDAAVVYPGVGTLTVLRAGETAFTPHEVDLGCSPPELPRRGRAIAPADLDQDGDLDLAVGCGHSDGGKAVFTSLALVRNDGDAFNRAGSVELPSQPSWFDIVQGPGNTWLLYWRDETDNSLVRRPVQGAFSFGPAERWAAGLVTAEPALADLNGDGVPDCALAVAGGAVVLASRPGGEVVSIPVEGAPEQVEAVRLLELEREGKRDLVALTATGIAVLQGQGETFGPRAVTFDLGFEILDVGGADHDQDGDLDLAVSGVQEGQGRIAIFRNALRK